MRWGPTLLWLAVVIGVSALVAYMATAVLERVSKHYPPHDEPPGNMDRWDWGGDR
jgi:hypothetical protein